MSFLRDDFTMREPIRRKRLLFDEPVEPADDLGLVMSDDGDVVPD